MDTREAAKELVAFLSESVPDERLPKSDVIFVFGGNDPRVARHGASLYKKGLASHVLITGGGGSRTKLPPGFSSEAEYYSHIMVEMGISSQNIILEADASNTLDNVLHGMWKFKKCRKEYPKSLIAVGIPLLFKRIKSTFHKYHPDTQVFGSAFQTDDPEEWLSEKWMRRAVGEVERLLKYAEKSDITSAEIPEGVVSAAAFLSTHLKS